MKLLFKNVKYVVSCDDSDRVYENADVYVRDGVIAGIGGAEADPDEVIDASGMVMYPGLINTHHHLYQTFSRNIPQVQNMELFPWLKYLYEIWKNINSEVIYESSLTGLGELLKTGCTCCFDHNYVFPAGTGMDLADAQFAAADLLGIRFYTSRGSMDLSVKDGGLPPDSVVQTVDEIMRSSEDIIAKYHDPSPMSMHMVALAPCSPFSVSRELLTETAKLARHLHVRLHTHVAETKDEENYTLERYGMRPLEYMESVGWTGEDVWYAHGIHFNDEEIAFLAKSGTGIAHCPVSNMKLSSGIARIPEMLKAGVKVGLAVDGSASNDGSDLLEEMRVCYLLHRLNAGREAPSGYDILKMATRGSAAVLGRNDIGQIASGKAADFFLIDLNRFALTGAQLDPASMLATMGYKGNVDYTVVNGEIVVKDGRLVNVDEEKESEHAAEVMERYRAGR